MLEIKKLKKYFGGVKAVDRCSFKISPNKITALIGPNGSGKTTIFNLISGIIKADSGNIIFQKKNITNIRPYKISNLGISRLFQQARLFNNLNIKENLRLALDSKDTYFWKNLFGTTKSIKKDERKINTILKIIDMTPHTNKYCRDLSYGQRRLTEIARTILKPHELLMLDEPVAGVTPPLRNRIARILLKLKEKGETILLIEHDMNFTLKVADHVIVLDEGKVIAEGTPLQIKNDTPRTEVRGILV